MAARPQLPRLIGPHVPHGVYAACASSVKYVASWTWWFVELLMKHVAMLTIDELVANHLAVNIEGSWLISHSICENQLIAQPRSTIIIVHLVNAIYASDEDINYNSTQFLFVALALKCQRNLNLISRRRAPWRSDMSTRTRSIVWPRASRDAVCSLRAARAFWARCWWRSYCGEYNGELTKINWDIYIY